jgi:hypothetical protein
MRSIKIIVPLVLILAAVCVAGCGVSKGKYEAVLGDKILLEEKVAILTKAKEALQAEYDALLKEKMDLATQLEITGNEKAALKAEYDKILDEKIAAKAAYDKLLADTVKKAKR